VRTVTQPQTESRQSQDQNSSSIEEEIAAAIALILAGGVVLPPSTTPLAAISALLLLIPGLPSFAGSEASGASVANAAARLAVTDTPRLPESSGALRTATVNNLSYRAHYAVEAMKRLAGSVASGEDLRGALRKEARYLAQHREAERRRTAGAKMVEAATELHGPILGWKHGHPREPRPAHLRADGMNFDATRIPASTGAMPGVLPGCTCTVVAPFENGRMLN
jgi:hypothetical protein